MLFLALESSCDETSAAVFNSDLQILSNVVAARIAAGRDISHVWG